MTNSDSDRTGALARLSARYPAYLVGVTGLFLAVTTVDAPLRYGLSLLGMPLLMYVPKALMVAALALAPFCASIATRRLIWAIAAVFALFAAVGWYYTGNVYQVALGVWVFLPIPFAALAYPAIANDWRRWVPFACALWAVALFGLLLDLLIDFPWADHVYSVGGFDVTIAKIGGKYHRLRMAGFTRTLFDAAYQLLFLGIWLVLWLRNRNWAAAVWIGTGVGIALATNKGAAAVFLLLSLFWLARRRVDVRLGKAIALFAIFLGTALPLSSPYVHYGERFREPGMAFLVNSFMTRLNRIWPRSVELVLESGNPVTGRGIGGVGVAQHHFERAHFSPGDNFYVFVFGMGGVLLLAGVVTFLGVAYWRSPVSGTESAFFFAALSALFLSGITSNIVEVPFQAFFLGFALHWGTEQWRKRDAAATGTISAHEFRVS